MKLFLIFLHHIFVKLLFQIFVCSLLPVTLWASPCYAIIRKAHDTSVSFGNNSLLIAQKDHTVFEDNDTIYIKRGKKLITKKYYTSNGRIASKVIEVDMRPPRTVSIYANWNEAGKLISKRKVIAFTGYAGTNRKIVWDYVLNGKRCLKRSLIGIK